MPKSYPRIYYMLKLHGHSPMKATEIIYDAKRKDIRALHWIKTCFKYRHESHN
jgi:hypothetical protein